MFSRDVVSKWAGWAKPTRNLGVQLTQFQLGDGGSLCPPYYCLPLPPPGFENLTTSLFCVKRLCCKIQSCELTIFKVGKLG